LSILEDILLIPNFKDKDRFKQILLEEKSSLEAGIIPSGHRVVNNRLKAQYSSSAWLTEQTSGIEYLFFIRDLINNFDQRWIEIPTIFEEIKRQLIHQKNLLVNITLDQSNWEKVQPEILKFISHLPSKDVTIQPLHQKSTKLSEGLIIPSQVNFVGKGGNLYEHGYREHGSMNVIIQYLRSTWLWDKVRVQGGAYGGFCNFDRFSGFFGFLSYRDPNLKETLNNYDLTSQFLQTFDLSESELTKSIIGAIGEIDAYQLPDAKGFTSLVRHLLGITDVDRQVFRDQLLATSIDDFRRLSLLLDELKQTSSIVVLGSAENINAANQEEKLFSETRKVL